MLFKMPFLIYQPSLVLCSLFFLYGYHPSQLQRRVILLWGGLFAKLNKNMRTLLSWIDHIDSFGCFKNS